MRLCTLALLVLAGCGEQTDIVARTRTDAAFSPKLDAGKSDQGKDAGFPDVELIDGGQSCSEPGDQLLLITPQYMASLTVPTTTRKTTLSPLCLEQGIRAAALDELGQLWVNIPDQTTRVVPAGGECSPPQAKESLDAMTFVFEPSLGQHVLYTLSNSVLYRADPQSQEPKRVGSVKASYLVGTRYGELFALRETEGQVAIDAIRLSDVAVEASWLLERPNSAALWGAAAGDGDLILLFETKLYRYRLDTEELTLMTSIVDTDVADHPVVVSPACGLR